MQNPITEDTEPRLASTSLSLVDSLSENSLDMMVASVAAAFTIRIGQIFGTNWAIHNHRREAVISGMVTTSLKSRGGCLDVNLELMKKVSPPSFSFPV
jgi:hypothetical protein